MLFLSSVAGQIGSQTDPPYSAAKAALINFAQCAAKDLAPSGVRVNTLCPGMVQTPLNRGVYEAWAREQPESERSTYEAWTADKIKKLVPLNRWQQPEDIAAMAVFLASSQATQHHRPDDQRRRRLRDALVGVEASTFRRLEIRQSPPRHELPHDGPNGATSSGCRRSWAQSTASGSIRPTPGPTLMGGLRTSRTAPAAVFGRAFGTPGPKVESVRLQRRLFKIGDTSREEDPNDGQRLGAVKDDLRTLWDAGTASGLPDAQLLEQFAAHRDDLAFAAPWRATAPWSGRSAGAS